MSNETKKSEDGTANTKAANFFWAMFRLRLYLIAIFLPVALSLVAEVVVLSQGRVHTGIILVPFLRGAFFFSSVLIASYVLKMVLGGSPLDPFSRIPAFICDWVMLPFLGFIRDLFQTPLIWNARQLEWVEYHEGEESSRPKGKSFAPSIFEGVILIAIFIGSFAIWRPYYRELINQADLERNSKKAPQVSEPHESLFTASQTLPRNQ